MITVKLDPQGRPYYIDHNTRTTTYNAPSMPVNYIPQVYPIYIQSPGGLVSGQRIVVVQKKPDQVNKPKDEPKKDPSKKDKKRRKGKYTLQLDEETPPEVIPHVHLPQGWEASKDSTGRIFFIDHNTRSTTYEDPR